MHIRPKIDLQNKLHNNLARYQIVKASMTTDYLYSNDKSHAQISGTSRNISTFRTQRHPFLRWWVNFFPCQLHSYHIYFFTDAWWPLLSNLNTDICSWGTLRVKCSPCSMARWRLLRNYFHFTSDWTLCCFYGSSSSDRIVARTIRFN